MRNIFESISWKNKDEIILIIVIILVGLGSFGLGRLSMEKTQKNTVSISDLADLSNDNSNLPNFGEAAGNRVVASKNGTTYHLPWCPGALKIKPENIVTFKNFEEAEKAGYNKASNCKGL